MEMILVNTLKFALLAGALWRVTKMTTEEEGPFSIFAIIRDKLYRGWVGRGIRCLWCQSFWLGLLLGIVLGPFSGEETHWNAIYGLALSTVAIWIDRKWFNHDRSP